MSSQTADQENSINEKLPIVLENFQKLGRALDKQFDSWDLNSSSDTQTNQSVGKIEKTALEICAIVKESLPFISEKEEIFEVRLKNKLRAKGIKFE